MSTSAPFGSQNGPTLANCPKQKLETSFLQHESKIEDSLQFFPDNARWGRFLPYLRLNVDQIPLPFVLKKIEPIITLKKATNSTKVEYG